MWGLSGSADAVVEHVVFRRCRIAVYGHTCTTRIHLGSGCPTNCVSVLQPHAARDPRVNGAFYGRARSAAMGQGGPEMGQSRTTRRIDSYDSARCFITARELRREWSLMLRYRRKKPLLSFLLFLSLFFTRDTFILFRAREPGSRVVFLEQWSNIWCRGNGNIFNNRYKRARYGCGGSDMRFVLSDVDYALMEYYWYAGRVLNMRAYRKILCIKHCSEWQGFLVKNSIK